MITGSQPGDSLQQAGLLHTERFPAASVQLLVATFECSVERSRSLQRVALHQLNFPVRHQIHQDNQIHNSL